MLGLRRRNLVGVDIDTSTVRMVQLRKDGGRYVVTQATVCDIVPWGNDPRLRGVHTVQALRQALASADIRSKYAVCGLRGPEVVVRGFEFPALTSEELAGAVELEISQICPFLAEESTFDYQVTSSDDKKTVGFWVAATNDLIENTRQLISEAGLHCALVDVAGLALLNLLDFQSKPGGTTDRQQRRAPPAPDRPASCDSVRLCPAVLNVGDSCASIAIADPAGRPFVRDIGRGMARDDCPALVAGRHASPGSLSAEEGWTARHDDRAAASDSLVEDVTTTLRYHATQAGSARVDRLLVCGTTDVVEEAVDLLRANLSIEVQPWNPLVEGGWNDAADMDPSTAVCDLQRYGPALAVAAGLAMRSI